MTFKKQVTELRAPFLQADVYVPFSHHISFRLVKTYEIMKKAELGTVVIIFRIL